RLGLLPADLAFMSVWHQRQPLRPRLAPDLHAGSAVAHSGGGLTIGVSATVDRVLDYPVDGGIVRTPPRNIPAALFYRQIKIMLVEPEQGLPRTAKLQDFVEDQC